MTKYWRYALIALALMILISIVVSIVSNTALTISGSDLEDGQISAESDFPNATCRKVIQFKFPPVRLECEEKKP